MTQNYQSNTATNFLKIIQINVNSIIKISRRYELQCILDRYNPDIVLLNETKLNSRHNLIFNNHKIIRKDRVNSQKGGGTAILIRNNIKYSYYSNSILNSVRQLETCIIKVPFTGNRRIFIISA